MIRKEYKRFYMHIHAHLYLALKQSPYSSRQIDVIHHRCYDDRMSRKQYEWARKTSPRKESS